MKKMSVVVFALFLLSGCQAQEDSESSRIEAAISDFYQADYDYDEAWEKYDDENNVTSTVVFRGQVYDSPYKQHVDVVSVSSGENLYDELYYYTDITTTRALFFTADGWVKQLGTRPRPHGYGVALEYTFVREDMLDGRAIEVYTSSYTVDIGKKYGFEEVVNATISQEYYLDKSEGILVKIITDLSDQNRSVAIANDMSVNGSSLEQAEQNYANSAQEGERHILLIYNYGNPTPFEIPDV